MPAGSTGVPNSLRSPGERWRPYRLLIVIYSLVVIAAGWELLHRGQPVDLYLDRQYCFVDAVAELYPDQAGVHQLKTTQILLCAKTGGPSAELVGPCEQFANVDLLQAAREHFERGLPHGKHIEDLSYDYVKFLVGTGAPWGKVEAAYRDWRRKFPLSERPDPRR
jgi:hypothetical protein